MAMVEVVNCPYCSKAEVVLQLHGDFGELDDCGGHEVAEWHGVCPGCGVGVGLQAFRPLCGSEAAGRLPLH